MTLLYHYFIRHKYGGGSTRIQILKMLNTSIYNQIILIRYKGGISITEIAFGFKVWHIRIISDTRFVMNLENILNLRNVFFKNKVWKVCQKSGKKGLGS